MLIAIFAESGLATPQDDAKEAAEDWLRLVDNSQFAETWNTAGPYLQHNVPREAWQRTLETTRKPLGQVVSRQLKSAKLMKPKMQGVPGGNYVTLQFHTTFANKKEAIETVTPVLQKDHSWKVCGYHVE